MADEPYEDGHRGADTEPRLGPRDVSGELLRLDANIEYLACRDLGNAVLRGKGKISVPYEFVTENFSAGNDEPAPSQFSVALEDAWKSVVAKREDKNSSPMIREITVAWREHWLGHWAAPIA